MAADLHSLPWLFHTGTKEMPSGPHVCTAGVLLTIPFPHLLPSLNQGLFIVWSSPVSGLADQQVPGASLSQLCSAMVTGVSRTPSFFTQVLMDQMQVIVLMAGTLPAELSPRPSPLSLFNWPSRCYADLAWPDDAVGRAVTAVQASLWAVWFTFNPKSCPSY